MAIKTGKKNEKRKRTKMARRKEQKRGKGRSIELDEGKVATKIKRRESR